MSPARVRARWAALLLLGLQAQASELVIEPPRPLAPAPPPAHWVHIQGVRASTTDDISELWIYTPRNRPLHSLMAYFQLFPRVTFSHGLTTGLAAQAPPPTLVPNGQHNGLMTPAAAAGSVLGAGSTASSLPSAWPGISSNPGYGQQHQAWSGGPSAWGGNVYNTPSFTGTATTISDPSLLVVRGLPQDIAQVQAFMDKVDIPVAEVQLRVYVLEVRDTENRNSAVQLLLNLLDGQLTATTGAATDVGNRLVLGGRDFSLALSRLTGDSRVRLVSSPTLRATDGSTASVTIGTDTPTLGSIVTFSGAVQQSVSYQSAGVLLNVSPHILNESIRLLIWQELSSFAKTETGLTTTPTKLRRAFRTEVVARHGEVIMLGGLSESSDVDNRQRGLLGLGSRSREQTSSEVVVLLQVLRL